MNESSDILVEGRAENWEGCERESSLMTSQLWDLAWTSHMWGNGFLLFILTHVLWLFFFPFRGTFLLLHFHDRWISSFPKFRFSFTANHILLDFSRNVAWKRMWSSFYIQAEAIFPKKFIRYSGLCFQFLFHSSKAIGSRVIHVWAM